MQEMLIDMNVDEALIAKHECVRWLNLIGCYRFYIKNRDSFSAKDKEYALELMHRIWQGIDTSLIPNNIRFKPGYAALPGWTLFKLQQEVFCKVKG